MNLIPSDPQPSEKTPAIENVYISSQDAQREVRDPLDRRKVIVRRSWTGLRWIVCLLIIWLVGQRAIKLWQQDDLQNWDFQFGWLILAACTNVLGWCPAVVVWQRMLASSGTHVAFFFCARAYFAGHLGKYVPGKAAVLAVRAAMLKPAGVNLWVGMITTTLETLGTMSVGLLLPLALVLSGAVRGPAMLENLLGRDAEPNLSAEMPDADPLTWRFSVALLVIFLIVPTIGSASSGFLIKLLRTLKPSLNFHGKRWSIPWSSWLLLSVGWGIHGVSYGLTLKGVTGGPITWHEWPLWTAAVSWATAGAFFVFLVPGGLGIREGLLIEFLRGQSVITSRVAVVSALILRLVWLLAEFTTAAVLYVFVRYSPPGQTQQSAE
ncbi:MAG: hypothetical protein ACKVT0_18660 [Planctomycetaceae bacterium]